MRWRIGLGPGLIAFVLGGCMLGPDYERPAAPLSAEFKEQAGWKLAEPSDSVDRGSWWAVFDDPLLDALMRQVVVSNQSLKASEAAVRQARAIVDAARSGLFPTISLDGSVRRSGGGSSSSSSGGSSTGTINSSGSSGSTGSTTTFSSSGSGGDQTTYRASLGAAWDLDVWGKIRRTVESDVASAQASAADLAAATLSAQADLASDYFQLRVLDEQKQLLDTSVAAYERSLQIAQSQYNWGIATRGDVAQAQTQLETTRSDAIAVGVQRAQFEHAIAVLVGEPPASFALAPTPLGAPPPPLPAGLPSALLERRPDVAAAERRMASANALIGVAEAAYFPDITISASWGFAATGIGSLFTAANEAWSVGIALAQTVLDAGARRAQVEQSRAAYDQTVATYRQTVLTSLQEVEDQLAALRILQQQAVVQQRAVAAAQDSERLQLSQYKAGTVAYTNVVTAQQASLTNQQTALTIQQNRFVATVELIRALGGGWSSAELPQEIGSPIPRPF
ncbi:efflux transporter outer membrane subunit [Defluviicoccus vanus]|uniref:Efflux transporter outer membrane subunit n=2 Tax=Defluviicoccus vanus TaxID=111831 RepID=A0A7H1N5T4_9PROT|nr:efflux transporter outer membrane subunit [Defluviicoccus vanus]